MHGRLKIKSIWVSFILMLAVTLSCNSFAIKPLKRIPGVKKTASNSQEAISACESQYRNNQYDAALISCRKDAEKDVALAQYLLANLYFHGLGVVPNNNEAFKWFTASANKGYALAQYNLGRMYSLGLGTSRNDKEAANWYKQAADKGLPDAEFVLSLCFRLGLGVPKDEMIAFEWYQKAALQGFAGAKPFEAEKFASTYPKQSPRPGQEEYEKGLSLQLGLENNHQDEEEAVRWLIRAAEKGNEEAMITLGNTYHLGIGIEQDDQEAFNYYHKAAELGNRDAQNQLSWMYMHGIGTPQDSTQAVKWFVTANKPVGSMNGDKNAASTKKPMRKAQTPPSSKPVTKQTVEEIEKDASKGNPDAQFKLGLFYLKGEGKDKDPTLAEQWFEKAANQNHMEAEYYLGKLLLQSNAAPNISKALGLFKNASHQGHGLSQYELGLMYLKGTGVPQNFVYAYSWLNTAAANGVPEAANARDMLMPKMTADQVLQAQQMSREMFSFTPVEP